MPMTISWFCRARWWLAWLGKQLLPTRWALIIIKACLWGCSTSGRVRSFWMYSTGCKRPRKKCITLWKLESSMRTSVRRDRPLKNYNQRTMILITPFSKERVASQTNIKNPSTETRSLRLPSHHKIRAKIRSKRTNHQKYSTSTTLSIKSKTSSTLSKNRPFLKRLYSKWSQSWNKIAT